MLSDTHPDAERVQIELLRRMTVRTAVAQWRSHYGCIGRTSLARQSQGRIRN